MKPDTTTWKLPPDAKPDVVPDEDIPWSDYFSGNIQPADLAYVRQTWLNAYYKSPWAGTVPNNMYEEVYSCAIDQLIARGSKILTIRNPADPKLIVAWICYEYTPKNEVVIHFVFTKPTYRKAGAAGALVDKVLSVAGADRCFYTFKTANARFFPFATFRPEIARRKSTRADG